MRGGVGYFFLGNMIVLVTLGIRAAYFARKMLFYLQIHYPERAKGLIWSPYKFLKAIYKKPDIDDPELLRLQMKARNADTWVILAMLPFPVFLLIILILSLVFGG